MIFARRNQLPSRIRVNKAGGISVLSFVRHLGLEDDAEFDIEVNRDQDRARLILTPVERVEEAAIPVLNHEIL